MTEEEQHELKDAALVALAKMAIRGSASYEYEIDTLRVALRELANACFDEFCSDATESGPIRDADEAGVAFPRSHIHHVRHDPKSPRCH